MKMVILSLFLAGLVLTSALAQDQAQTSKPAMATLHVQPNFDFSLTSKEFRVHYSGLGDEFASTSANALIKIYKEGNPSAVLSYTVANKEEKKAYYFALDKNAMKDVEGLYEVQVCAGSTCSAKNPALTKITDNTMHQLTCEEGSQQADGTWKTSSEFKLPFNGPLETDWIKEASEFETIQTDLNNILTTFGHPANYKTDFKKYDLEKSPTYKQTQMGRVLHIAVKYDVAQYKKLFDKKQGETDTRPTYSHDFCKRKYLLSAHAHLVNKGTNEVQYRFKTTLNLSGAGKKYYIMDPEAATTGRKVHVEMTHIMEDIADGTYRIHVTFCATEKDGIDSTFCADPIVYKDDFVVLNSQSV